MFVPLPGLNYYKSPWNVPSPKHKPTVVLPVYCPHSLLCITHILFHNSTVDILCRFLHGLVSIVTF